MLYRISPPGGIDKSSPKRHVHRRSALINFHCVKTHFVHECHVLLEIRPPLFHAYNKCRATMDECFAKAVLVASVGESSAYTICHSQMQLLR
eukprot:SAG31_NODE_1012_length_10379_cov_3.699319_8_plen_92_part_00